MAEFVDSKYSVAPNVKMENLKASYLSVHQGLEFSPRVQTPPQTVGERADIERRRLFLKYMTSKTSVNARFAGCLMKDDLEGYTNVVDSPSSLNNYWKQFDSLNVTTTNEPLEWEFHTSDPNAAHKHVQPLSCQNQVQQQPTLECKNEQLLERDVEKVSSWWRSDEISPRARKVSRQDQSKVIVEQVAPRVRSVSDFEKNEKALSNSANKLPIGERQSFGSDRSQTIANKVNAVKSEQTRPNKNRDERQADEKCTGFNTARTVYNAQQANKHNKQAANKNHQYATTTTTSSRPPAQLMKKSLGGKAFVCPLRTADRQPKQDEAAASAEPVDERLKGIEPKMIELIKNEIMDCGSPITWDDIAGLERAKRIIQEIVVYPMLRPDIFTGLRRPPKGILLFGPPGTGKTLIGKCIASQSKSTFFSISASSLTSKWVGEGEKMVRALFAVAQVEQPSVVFIDEIDSLLCQRSETEHESSRRMKTEFLVQLDGASTGDEDRILVIGATNRPHELDEAARRRLVKRLYIPLPELEARQQIVRNLLKSERHDLTEEDVHRIASLADGYSGADMTNLCKEASMGPIRSIPFEELEGIDKEDVRQVTLHDFQEALDVVRPSVSPKDLSVYLEWDRTYGTASAQAR